MAKIVLSDAAPKDAERLTFSLPGAEPFEAPYESDSPIVLANAESHPWLKVERDEDGVVDPPSHSPSVDPREDRLSALYEGSDDEAAPAEPEEDVTPLAVEAGLDQNVAETVGEGDNETAVTLAADDADSPAPKTRRKSSSAAKEN